MTQAGTQTRGDPSESPTQTGLRIEVGSSEAPTLGGAPPDAGHRRAPQVDRPPDREGTPVIEVWGLRKEYHMGDTVVAAMRGIDLKVWTGEMVMVMGPSGSGKSTFMNVVGCLDRPTAGSYKLDGVEVSTM